MMKDDFNEARVMEAAEHIRKKMTAFLEAGYGEILKDCPAYENGLQNGETQMAIIRALGLMVLDRTQRLSELQYSVEDLDDYAVPDVEPPATPKPTLGLV